jgi:hypothetical protein
MVIDAIRDCVKDLWESLSEHECPSCGVKFNDNDPWQRAVVFVESLQGVHLKIQIVFLGDMMRN